MKFLVGMLMGVVVGMLCLISSIAAFFAGLALGWKAFSDESDEAATPVEYRGMSPDKPPTATEEVPAT